jgi:lipopolysaccharide biosynthesis glycosyltransferase
MPAMLDRSISSLATVHPELPVHVERLESATLLDKARIFDLSPFDQTLFLDADTVVMGDLAYGFESAEKFGLACCICECPWARRYSCFSGDAIEYNTGVIFFTKDWESCYGGNCPRSSVRDVFKEWAKLAGELPSASRFIGKDGPAEMPHNDQASFAAAIDRTGFNPWILPLNWNFRHRWQKTVFGPVKIWHDYDPVPDAVINWNKGQTSPGAIIQCARVS